jgi:hypothetical protein
VTKKRTMTALIENEEVRAIAMNIPCDWCKAGPQEPCTQDGEPLPTEQLPFPVHIARVAPIWVIYKVGYRQGCRDMKREIKHDLNRIGLDL